MSKRSLRWLVLAVSLAASPVRADVAFARYDLELSQHIVSLSRLVSQAEKLFEDWTKGRQDSAPTRARLAEVYQTALLKQRAIARLTAPSGARILASGAARYATTQLDVISGAGRLVKAGPPDPEALRRFLDQSLVGNRLSQQGWFSARQACMAAAARPPLPASARGFYGWQESWLPIWLEESRLTTRVEHLLSSYSRETAAASSAEIKVLIQQSLALNGRASRLSVAPTLLPLQQSALSELTAMARVCEAVDTLFEDPSADSANRLRRMVTAVNQSSEAVESLTIELLKSSLAGTTKPALR